MRASALTPLDLSALTATEQRQLRRAKRMAMAVLPPVQPTSSAADAAQAMELAPENSELQRIGCGVLWDTLYRKPRTLDGAKKLKEVLQGAATSCSLPGVQPC